MKKIIYILISGLLLLSNPILNAQNDESMVVISEENLIILIKKLRAHRNAQINVTQANNVKIDSVKETNYKLNHSNEIEALSRQIAQLEIELIHYKSIKDTTYVYVKNDNSNVIKTILDTTNVYAKNENSDSLKSINKELETIRHYMQELSKRQDSIESIATNPSPKQYDYTYIAPVREREVIIKENNVPVVPIVTVINSDDNYNKLQKTLDSLRTELVNSKTPIAIEKVEINNEEMPIEELAPQTQKANYETTFLALQNQLATLKSELDSKNSALTAYELLKAKFKDYEQKVFFANNSIALSNDANKTIDQLFTLLNDNNNLDILIKGFASNKGNPKYNENLSMQRTETIKKALIQRGIHPTRVLTQYHGIDYNAKDSASARRVETSFIVRK